MLEDMHIGTLHKGKVPENSFKQTSLSEKIALLKVQLNEAIKVEAYEDAALIRDELESLSKELSNSER